MKVNTYSQWKHTSNKMQMLLQMMGKTKVVKMRPQPQWNHTLLLPTATGFTTGLIPDGASSFEVILDLNAGRIDAHCTTGASAGFSIFGEKSVADLYASYNAMLSNIGHATKLNPIPQEYYDTTPMDQQTTATDFDRQAAMDYFALTLFAYDNLLTFASRFRGKKILPSMFWGTFDMTTVLFAGNEHPFPGEGIIERVAFDEQFIEFGFWPGDEATDDPAFFVLPYPFMDKVLPSDVVRPEEAFYSAEKAEYFLPVKDLMKYDDPGAVLQNFLCDSFDVLTKEKGWEQIDWFKKPLLI